ncbi:DUF2868 domain-containing protein [Massilia sp. PAMC28688]|uniref:DUF2868 domain-containing protein n=1 Tax=Massilia sp. PAMC28688 TaxID=2861283 RepID=UPI001C62EBBA|nr:DUF2868 domain-containing protein [Massilia sp. PAMC28688]QYF94587.1 DUF2868 domain-containing protein [Massilia sp. PAMC28688]
MNEQVARDVVLVRAIETMDSKCEVLSEDDRMYASRSARELAQWQAAENKSEVTSEHFLQQRSEQILKRLRERTPALSTFLARRSGLHGLSLALPFVALLLGAGLDRISDPHRVDLLSAPLLAIIGWNLLVYVILLIWMFVPSRSTGWSRRVTSRGASLPRKLPHALSSGLAEFTAQWTALSAPLNRARMARAMHLAAAFFALGAMLSLYARGFLSEYRAGWESTFLDAGQVHQILSVMFAPALALFPLEGFTLDEIEALRFSQAQSPSGGARWVHLYGATLFLLVVLPRLVLAAVAHWKARRLASHFPLDLEQPYFRKLGGQAGVSVPAVLRVLPYSFTVDEARDRGLSEVATMLLGEQARVMLRPPSPYGEEAIESLKEVRLDDPDIAVTAVLFNLAATPEKENHGAFLDHLVRTSRRGVAALLDESSLAERSEPERLAERVAHWQQFCQYHKVPVTVVNLIHPQQRPVDQLPVSKAP